MIRKLQYADKPQLVEIIEAQDNFNSEEKEVAVELLNIALDNPEQKDYYFFVFEEDNKILGYHCTGLRPLTDGVFDLYWIAVHPGFSGKGIGTKLLNNAISFAMEKKGRWLLAETSSKEDYSLTRDFYLKNEFEIIASIKDFYKVSDDLIIYGKRF